MDFDKVQVKFKLATDQPIFQDLRAFTDLLFKDILVPVQ